ncbi:MAG: hypothetical protein FWG27_00650 [Treponema sp.]|nr:hypothetical protein [Treponema sp.]
MNDQKGSAGLLIPAAVFVYDCSRLVFLLLVVYLRPGVDFGFPLMMFIAPNALFPLMSFFLLIHFDGLSLQLRRAYIPLYITGKFLAALCVTIWLLFSLRQMPNPSNVLLALCICGADLGTIMGMALRNEDNPQEMTVQEMPIKIETMEISASAASTAETAEGGE